MTTGGTSGLGIINSDAHRITPLRKTRKLDVDLGVILLFNQRASLFKVAIQISILAISEEMHLRQMDSRCSSEETRLGRWGGA